MADPDIFGEPRPFVTANFALTWDGRVTTRNFTPADFSSKRDKHRMLEVRAPCDAILAGAGTIAADNMAMGLPSEELRAERVARGQAPYPQRVIVTNTGQLNPELRVFQRDFSPVHVFSTARMPHHVREALVHKAVLHLEDQETIDLRRMLTTLHREHGVQRLVCEGGPQLFRSFLAQGLVDEIHLTFCPRIFGSEEAPTLTGPAGAFLPESIRLELQTLEQIGEEVFLRYGVLRSPERASL